MKELKEVMQILDKEIAWCRANQSRDEFEKGFIAGLLQARTMVKTLKNLPH